ncbi:MAG: hypothetical protein AAF559_12480 [Pseudomonadota bacterium]
MSILRAAILAAFALFAASTPAQAKAQQQVFSGVSFFERTNIGAVDFAAANIFYDERCVDPEFCFSSDQMAISVILLSENGLAERIMRLGDRVRVPGGTLALISVGTPPSDRGAIQLDRYSLTFVFTPDPPRRGPRGS